MMVAVRPARASDAPAIRLVHERAFNGSLEANIVDAIVANGRYALSLVAVRGTTVVAHILFSEARVEHEGAVERGMGLAPMSVDPSCQREGIGSCLVRDGLDRLDAAACPFVVVVGHPQYYPRFGFEPASRFGVRPQWDGIPDEAFFIRVRSGGPVPGAGVARYVPEFDAAV